MQSSIPWNRAILASVWIAALAATAPAGDEPVAAPKPPSCTLRGEVLRAGAPEKARVEVRRVATAESTPADEEWYRRAAAERTLFATLADGSPLATVDANVAGGFEVNGLSPGVYEVRAVAGDGATCCVAARATSTGETVRVVADLPGGALTIDGLAVHRDGSPFHGLVAIDARDFDLTPYHGSDVVPWPGAVATDDAGKFRLRGVSSGLHRFIAVRPGAFAARSARFLDASAPVFVVDGGPRELAGAVTDGATGAVVPGAIVSCPATDDPAVAVAADARGTFRLPVPDGAREIAVCAPGYLREIRTLRDGAPLDLRLVRGATVAGRVAAADGTPVPGARVLAIPTERGRRDEERVTTTGADGRYEFAAVEPGAYAVFVLGDAWVSPEVIHQDPYADWNPLAMSLHCGERAALDLLAVRCVRIRGTVAAAAGRPVAGAEVESWPQDGSLWSGVADRLPRGASAPDGSFEFGGLPDRRLTLYARVGKCTAQSVDIPETASGSVAALQLAFRPTGFVEGIVRTPQGVPVAGAKLRFFSASGCIHAEYGEFLTRADGSFHAGPFDLMEPSVEAEADGFQSVETTSKVGTAEPLEIILTPGLRFAGVIALPARAPRGDVWLDVTRLPAAGAGGDERQIETIRAADDGSFRTGAMAPGRYRIDARFAVPDGRSWVGSATATTGGPSLEIALTAVAGAPRPWSFRVVEPGGEPAARASAIVGWRESRTWMQAAGRVESGVGTVDLPPGTGSLWVRITGAAGSDGVIGALSDCVAGPFDAANAGTQIRLAPGAVVSGVARREDGSPLAGMTICAVPLDDPPGGGFAWPVASTRSRADGSFAFAALMSGCSYRITSEPPEPLTVDAPVVDAGTSGVELIAGRGVTATIRVLDWAGRPVPGANVVVRRTADANGLPVVANATDAAGRIAVPRVAARTPYVVRVEPPRARGDLRAHEIAAWMPTNTDVTLARDFVLRGVVAAPGGRGVAQVVVWARVAGGAWTSAETDRAGAFVLAHLSGADLDVAVVRSGGPDERFAQKLTIGDAPARLVYDAGPSVEVTIERTVEVTYQNAGLDLAYRATLVLGDGPDGPLAGSQIVREGGTFVFDHLKDGARYSVWITADPDVRTWSLVGNCAFRSGLVPGEGQVLLSPGPGPAIEGRLTCLGRALPADVRVTATHGALRCRAEVVGDHFVARGLVPGLWTIEAEAQTDGRVLRGVAEAEAGASADVELRVR